MRILNYRRGFACNSSSTHSVVLFDKAAVPQHDFDADDDFGWNHFTLVTREAKQRYAFAQLYSTALAAARQRLAATAPPYAYGNSPEARAYDAWALQIDGLAMDMLKDLGWPGGIPPSVDHQSQLAIPTTFNGNGILKPFAKKLLEFFARDNVGVLGGNDNDDAAHPLLSRAQKFLLRELGREYVPVGRDDKTHFVLFSKHTGSRTRITFDDDVTLATPLRAATPELVDLKLTDYCDKGCSYCYQGSTTKGRHASMAQVESILQALAGNRVFEVAFGGGEPTSHPNFVEILKLTRSLGMVPNFTTRHAKFLREHPELFDANDPIVGGVAFSVDSVDDMADALEEMGAPASADAPAPEVLYKLQWQVVHGAVSTRTLTEMVDSPYRRYRPLLLLGWKTTGRGGSVAPVECDWEAAFEDEVWEETAGGAYANQRGEAIVGSGLLIDTEFQRQFGKRLREMGALPETLGQPEGTFAMYIDAVNGVLGPSSYCEKKLMRPFEPFPSREFIREAWDMLSVDGGEKWANGGLL